MIEVRDLTKRYPGRTAVNGLTFSVGRGEVVGFLGPNGAGKSTTMRILSSFMPATSGTARVAGFDVFHEADEVRRRIGYMPENNPLHLDMRVREYLKFRARLKGLGWRRSRERVDTVLRQCGLIDVERRIIGQLSKGYRQRVGLADALVHEPDLVILDEPTIGLDVVSAKVVREFLRRHNRERKTTIVLTSHYMADIQELCERVVIIDKGTIFFDGLLAEVMDRFADYKLVTIRFDHADKCETSDPARFGEVIERGEDGLKLKVKRDRVIPVVKALLDELPVKDFSVEEVPIEDVIRQLFQREAAKKEG